MSGSEEEGSGRVLQHGDAGSPAATEAARVEGRQPDDELSSREWDVRDCPSDARAWSRLAFQYCEAGRGGLALDAAERATRLAPLNGHGWWALSVARWMNGDTDGALEAARHTARLVPGNATAQFNLGNRLLDSGLPREAVPVLEAARQGNPTSLPVRRALALAWHCAGDHAPAVELLDEVLQEDPEYPELWVALGVSLADLGRFAEAMNALETAVFHLPERGVAWARLGQTYHELGRHSEAVQAFLKAVEHGSTAWGVWRDLGRSAAELGDLLLLGRACDELEKERPAEAAVLRKRLDELQAAGGDRPRRPRRRRPGPPSLRLPWLAGGRGKEEAS